MKRQWFYLTIFLLPMAYFSCQSSSDNGKSSFCNHNMDYKIFQNDMFVGFEHMNADHTLNKKYGCKPNGLSIFPSIEFSGLPDGSTHLHIEIVDATCSYGCNACCQFKHCVLEFPLSALKNKEAFSFSGIKESNNPNEVLKKYLKKNDAGKNEFFPLCPPPFQTHAYYIRMSALKITKEGHKTILGKTQSTPGLIWSEKEVRSYKNKQIKKSKKSRPSTSNTLSIQTSNAPSTTPDSSQTPPDISQAPPDISKTPAAPSQTPTDPSQTPTDPSQTQAPQKTPTKKAGATQKKTSTPNETSKSKKPVPLPKANSQPVNPNTPAPKGAHYVKPLPEKNKKNKSTKDSTLKVEVEKGDKPVTFEQNSWK